MKSNPLYIAYKEWCDLNGERQEPQNKFAIRLKEMGYDKKRRKYGVVWTGIGLRGDEDPTPGDGGDSGGSNDRGESDPTPGAPPDRDPTPPESGIDKPNAEDVPGEGVGCVPYFGLSAKAPYANTGVNRKTPTPPYTPTPILHNFGRGAATSATILRGLTYWAGPRNDCPHA